MDVLVELDLADGDRRVVRYNVSSWRIVRLFVNALFAPGGQWDGLRYREFRMKRVDELEAANGDTA